MAIEVNDKVLVVIPCLNEERHIGGLLAQLGGLPASWRVVVADGGSTDRSREIVAQAAALRSNFILVDNPRRIQSAGINLAVAKFGEGFRWLVRIDAHCLYPDRYVEGLVKAAGRSGAASVVVPMVTKGEGCFQLAVAAVQNSVLGNGGSPHRNLTEGRFVEHGHHALFDIALFSQVGGYDEAFSHNEDAELDQRLVGAGAKIWLEPSLALIYYPRRTPVSLFRQYYKYGEGRARTFQRHKMPLKLRQIVPIAVGPAVIMSVISPASAAFALPGLAWAGLCLGYGAILAVKSRTTCVALSGFAAMVMHLAWSLGFISQLLFGSRPCAPASTLKR